jgi:hypothetical protein
VAGDVVVEVGVSEKKSLGVIEGSEAKTSSSNAISEGVGCTRPVGTAGGNASGDEWHSAGAAGRSPNEWEGSWSSQCRPEGGVA